MDSEESHNKQLIEQEIASFSRDIALYEQTNPFVIASNEYIRMTQRARAYTTKKGCELDAGTLRMTQVHAEADLLRALQGILDTRETFDDRVLATRNLLNQEMKNRHEQLELVVSPFEDPKKYSPNQLNEFIEVAFLLNEGDTGALIEDIADYYHADIQTGTNIVIEKLGLYAPSERRNRALKRVGGAIVHAAAVIVDYATTKSKRPTMLLRPSTDQPHTSPLWQSGHPGLHE